MAAPRNQPPWQWNPTLQTHYFWNPETDEIVQANGKRDPRPPAVSQESLMTASFVEASSAAGPSNYQHTRPDVTTGRVGQQYQEPRTVRAVAGPSRSAGTSGGVDGLTSSMTQMTVSGNPRIISNFTDTRTGVQTVLTGSSRNADRDLARQGVDARYEISSRGTQLTDQLFPGYKIKPPSFFKLGRIFTVLWAEPAGGNVRSEVTGITQGGITQGIHGERVHSKIRRFVVIRETAQYCSALPIATYGGRGVGKHGVVKSEHCIIFTGPTAPLPLESERPNRGEDGMRTESIRVDPDHPSNTLDRVSRLDFGRVHTVHTNIKVKPFGKVNGSSLQSLIRQFALVWGHQMSYSQSARPSSPGMSAQTAAAFRQLLQRGYTQDQAHAFIENQVANGISRLIVPSANTDTQDTGAQDQSDEERNNGGDDSDDQEEADGSDDEEEDDDEDED